MAAVVSIVIMGYLIIEVCHRIQPNESKLVLYKPLLQI